GLVGGGIWVWYKLTEDVRNAKQAVEDFPDISDITHEQAESLREMSGAVTGLNTELTVLGDGTDFSVISGHFETLGAEIETLNNDRIQSLRENFQSLPTDVQEALAESVQASIDNIEGQTKRVEEIFNRLTEIQRQAYDENGEMRQEYVQEIKGLTDELMSHYAIALAENEQQYQEIFTNLTRDRSQLTYDELETRRGYLKDSLGNERTMYESHLDDLWQLREG